MVMRKTQRKQLHIKGSLIDSQPKQIITADSYRLPFTLGNVPDDVLKVQDKCFSPVNTLLEHALNDLGSEGIPMFIGYGALTGLAQNGLIRAGVEQRANEMTRKWGELVRSGEKAESVEEADDADDILKKIESDMNTYNVRELFRQAAAFCGYYGGMLLFIDNGEAQNALANPLVISKETFIVGSLKGLRPVEPFTVSPGFYNSSNPLAGDYYKPSVWYVQGVPVHASRFLYFSENDLPTLLKPAYNFFGLPLAQNVLDAVSHFTGCRESSARLLKKYSLTVFKTNMDDVLSGGFGQELNKRVDYFTQMRDNDGTVAIDKEMEDLVVMTTSLAGVTDVVRQSMEYVAAMFNEPVTKMWGLSPAGFNTGDSDLKNHYDNIASLQERMFGEPMKKLLSVLQMNAFGEVDETIGFKFAKLSEEDESLKVSNNKVKAETDTILLDAGIISPEEARQRLIDSPSSEYNNLTPYDPEALPQTPLEPFNPDEETPIEGLEQKEDVFA